MDAWAVVDGREGPLETAVLPVTDVGVTHGLSVYETLEAGPLRDPAPNLRRLRASCDAVGVPMPDVAVLLDEIERVRARVGPVVLIRLTLTGDGRRVLWGSAPDPKRLHAPIRAARAPHVDHPLLPGWIKHRSRAAWMATVRRLGVDELLLVDAAGRFTEASSNAVVAVIGGRLVTAPWDGRILQSTTLERLLGTAVGLGIEVVREGPPSAGPWDALYVASTTRSLAPVGVLDGEALPTWDPVGRALADADDGARGIPGAR